MKQSTSVSKPFYVTYVRVFSLVFTHIDACWLADGFYKNLLSLAALIAEMFSCICRPAFWPETYFPLLFILFYFPLFYSLRRRTSLGPTHHDNINAGNSKTCLPRQATIIFFWSMYRNYEIHVCIYKYGHSTLSMET